MGESVQTPRHVGRYAIFDEIAAGGMATVYIGRLAGSGGFTRTVAIKSLHPQFAKDPEFVTMFLDEARLAARIRHPNVVPTLDVVASKGELFLVMEYVQGESLSRLARATKARGERIPLPILLRLMADALRGLHAAHEARDEHGVGLDIVHRDVTPQNILVGIDGVARLLDFGVAKAAGRAHTTREGQIKGKLAYMAPEQIMGVGVSRATDLYAASVVLWEMLTGERLFAGGSEVDVVAKLLSRKIEPPRSIVPDLPQTLDDLVMKGLAAKVEDRFATARDMCMALGECGVSEAPGIAVGEWVERIAAQALADRTAKIAAIERRSGLPARNFDSSPPDAAAISSSPPPDSTGPSTLPPPTGTARSAADAVTVTMNTSIIRRDARVRAVGIGTAVVGVVLAAGVASVRIARDARERANAPAPASPSIASAAALPSRSIPLPREVPGPSDTAAPATAAPQGDVAPVASERASQAPPVARPDPTTSHRVVAAVPPSRPSATAPKPKTSAPDVFGSRE